MEKELIINKENAIDTLHRMSAHLGSKLQAAELFSSCDDDKQRIEPMWVAAVTELSGLLMPYSSLTLYADKALFSLHMPDNWKEEQFDNLVKHCEVYISNALFANWLSYFNPENALFYKNLNREGAVSIEHLLALRRKPV
jgi:hypothetical protein